MTRRFLAIPALLLAALLASPALAQGAPPAGFEVVSRDPATLEIRFHNMPLKAVHADASQNALALDFLGGVDGSALDRLAAAMPDWISMAYANYDSGVIRASRPVTFLTRNENDGFSLRMVAAGPPAMVAAPNGAVALRGPVDGSQPPPPGPPPPNLFARYNAYGALRGYGELELAVNRGEPYWENAYAHAAIQSNSKIGLGTEYQAYHSGDQVITSHAHMKIALADGVSIIGSVDDIDAGADQLREPNGSFASNTHTNLFTGALGLGWDMTPDSGVTLQALEGNNITGVKFTGYYGDPSKFWQLDGELASAPHRPRPRISPLRRLHRSLWDWASPEKSAGSAFMAASRAMATITACMAIPASARPRAGPRACAGPMRWARCWPASPMTATAII